MTDAFYSEPTNNIVDFKPRSQLAADDQLAAFIEWAKQTLPKFSSEQFGKNQLFVRPLAQHDGP